MSASTLVFNVKADTAQMVNGLTKAQMHMNKTVKSMKKSVDSLKFNVLGLAGAYVSVQTAIKGFEIVQKQAMAMVNVAAQFEKFNATLKTVEGSSQAAKRSMEWIEDFAATTPYNIEKVTSSFISLRSYGLDPTDGLLRTLGDTSAAMGKDLQQAVEAMADAVVGENERLKEFGIRASKMGDQIKYTWTNASGEMRQAVADNNSAIIEDTLTAIFNSKYAGAMEAQSKTWNGLISNMQDNWTLFQENLMNSGVFDYLKAIVTVVGEYMSHAFSDTLDNSKIFTTTSIESIRSLIISFGSLYDSMETFGDYFSVIGNILKISFYGIYSLLATLQKTFFDVFGGMFDFIVEQFNALADFANSTGLVSIGYIESPNNKELFQQMEKNAYIGLEQAKIDLANSYDDLMNTGKGSSFVNGLVEKIDATYEKLKNAPSIDVSKTDFGDAVVPVSEQQQKNLVDYVASSVETVAQKQAEMQQDVQESVSKSVEDATESLEDFKKKLKDDNGSGDDIYTVVNNITNGFETFGDVAEKTNDSVVEATRSLDKFAFAFSDKFISSISSTTNSLSSIVSTTSQNAMLSYQDALAVALQAKENLINNPLDVNVGEAYKSAYNALVSSADRYLNIENFSSAQEYALAQATVGSQIADFQNTAIETVDVLSSMNNLLASINQAFVDGILTDEEKATIAGVATDVNAKNEQLLVGNNSVSSFIQALMGGGTSGISLARIESTLPALSVNTGLDVDALVTNTRATKDAVYNTSIKGSTAKTIDNLRIQSESTTHTYYQQDGSLGWPTNYSYDTVDTVYHYYAKGGFTGQGYGKRDASGEVPAGIVHAGEWVAPKWMVSQNPVLFGALEMHRLGKRTQSNAPVAIASTPSKTDKYLFVLADEMKQMNSLLRRVTDGGEAMKTEVVA